MAASTSPMSTFRTYLMHRATASADYTKLVDIITAPASGGTPNMIEVTTLSDKRQRFVPGVEQQGDGYQFTANYTLADYTTLNGLAGTEHDYAMWFGGSGDSGSTATPSGDDGKFPFKGVLSVYVNEANVDEARTMTITIAPTEPMELGS